MSLFSVEMQIEYHDAVPPHLSHTVHPSHFQQPTSASSSQPDAKTASAVLLSLTGGLGSSPSAGVSKDIDDLLESQRAVRAQRAHIA